MFPQASRLLSGSYTNVSFSKLQAYFVELENERTLRVAMIARLYERIGPILNKLEYLILGTSTGKSVVMQSYYTYWERKIFKALIA